MFWTVFSCLAFLSAYIYDICPPKQKKYAIIVLVLVLSYVTGFGGLVGQDHDNYILFYERYNSFSALKDYSFSLITSEYQVELLYVLLMIFCHLLGLGVVLFFFIVAFLSNYFYCKFFSKYNYLLFSVLLFIVSVHYFQQVNLVRQMLAGSIVLLGISYLDEKKHKEYLLCIFCAMLIHVSAIIFSLFAFSFIKKKKVVIKENNVEKPMLSYILAGLWVISLFSVITGYQLDFINDILGLVLHDTHYEGYMTGHGVGMQAAVHYVYNILVPISFIVSKKNHFWIWTLFVIGGILNNVAFSIPNITRLAYYFSGTFFVFVPYMCDKHNYDKKIGRGIDLLKIFVILYYVRELVFNHILNPKELLGTQMYTLSEIFR